MQGKHTMSGLQVCLVVPRYFPAIGGVERYVQQLAEGLVRHGAEVQIVTTDPTGELPRDSVVHSVPILRFSTLLNSNVYYLSPHLGTWLNHNAHQFDIIHAHSYHTPLALQAAYAARRSGIPFVFTTYYHGTGHSLLRTFLHIPYRPLGAWAIRQAQRVFCISNIEKHLLTRHFGSDYPYVVVPTGIDTSEIRTAEPYTMPDNRTVIFTASRLEDYKQIDRTITAMAWLPANYVLCIAGQGPSLAKLQTLVKKLNLQDRVVLLGHIPRSELVSRMRSADIFVTLSRRESFGLALLEGAVGGAAVVASDIPAHREVATYLPDGRIHFVAPDAATSQITEALQAAAQIGRTEQAMLWSLPSWEGMVDVTYQHYLQVLDRIRRATN